LKEEGLPLFAGLPPERRAPPEPAVKLSEMRLGEHVASDYAFLELSLKAHPMALLRAEFQRQGVIRTAELAAVAPGERVTVAGLVLVRQRPGSANGVIFATLEDETGIANLVIWTHVFERFRAALMGATLLACTGQVQREGIVIHVVAERLVDLSPRLGRLTEPGIDSRPAAAAAPLSIRSRDFH